ncbi:MAG: formyltransferase family protein, partial [Planctomycetota bacterium]
ASATWSWIAELDVDLVVLAGYLRLLPIESDFAGRVLNIHPSLLPRHGGKGMHGERVHAAVLAAGDAESGCTVHLCDERYDEGRILVQARVPVLPGDEPARLAARVFQAECEAYPAGIAMRWREIVER